MGQGNVKLLTVPMTASVKSIGRSGAKWSLRDFLTGPWEQAFLIMCRLLANGYGTSKTSPWASDSVPQTNHAITLGKEVDWQLKAVCLEHFQPAVQTTNLYGRGIWEVC